MWKGRIPCQISEEHSEISKLLLLLLLQGEDFVSGIAMNKSHASEGHSEMKSVATTTTITVARRGFRVRHCNEQIPRFVFIYHAPSK